MEKQLGAILVLDQGLVRVKPFGSPMKHGDSQRMVLQEEPHLQLIQRHLGERGRCMAAAGWLGERQVDTNQSLVLP